MAVLSFHFHGYQPGDIVRWVEPDPLKPLRFEERVSPVAHRIGGERVVGRNWTDAVLHAYGRMESVLERVSGAASVDIEPQTLAWLLEKDEAAYRRVLAAWERGVAGFALTPPFHAILPHHHRLEREILFEVMIDFFAPVLRRCHGRPIGLWLPEAAHSAETMESYVAAARHATTHLEGLPDVIHGSHLVCDARQIAGGKGAEGWYRAGGMPAFARDPAMSGDFAFGASRPPEFATAAQAHGHESLLVAADLEFLLANPTQAERFERIVEELRSTGRTVTFPTPPPKMPRAQLVEFSSWSDYEEHLAQGHTSDTRWTGIRRADGHVVGRHHRDRPLSQLWKHAFTLATEQIETAIRRAAREILPGQDDGRKREMLRRLAVAYGRHVWQEHYRAAGLSSGEVDFAKAVEGISGGLDVEVVAYLARGYVMMLMGLRSDPRFWDNPDTRVTFQNVACLAQALLDVSEAARRARKEDLAQRLLQPFPATLFEFVEAYGRHGFGSLHGAQGWETTETAWLAALQSEVSPKSGYGVVRRATLFAIGESNWNLVADRPLSREEIVADTGHIVGESHGEWSNPTWCEHGTK
ncbi:MAG: hypothetical protein HY557_08660 [Euryarchaeota archaeon]|nr:hypothetical protein [Euryarchaeota archaeon]